MRLWPTERIAAIAIGIVLLVLVRSLGEYFRLKYVYGQGLTIATIEPFIIGSLAAAICIGLAFTLYVLRRHKSVIVLCTATVVGLLAYKILLMH